MGHVSGLEYYECVIWKVCMGLSRIDDESVWWLWMRVVGGWFASWKWYDILVIEEYRTLGSDSATRCRIIN